MVISKFKVFIVSVSGEQTTQVLDSGFEVNSI